MRRTHSGFRAVAVAVALVAGSELRSQTVSPDSSAVEVAASLRRDGHAGKALLVLTQAGGRQPQQVMDEVADTLVAIAVSFPGNDASGASTRAVAQTTLLRAAKGESGAVGAGIGRGIPYAGAADRFIRIAETAQDVGIRGAALWALTQLPNNAGLLPFLRQVATSQNPAAFRAVDLLADETGPAGR
jgi:hypothetical protein